MSLDLVPNQFWWVDPLHARMFLRPPGYAIIRTEDDAARYLAGGLPGWNESPSAEALEERVIANDPGPWYRLLTEKRAIHPTLFHAISRGLVLAARELEIEPPRFVVFRGPLDQKPPAALAWRFAAGRILGITLEVQGEIMVGVVSHLTPREGFLTAAHEAKHAHQLTRGLEIGTDAAEEAARRFEAKFARRYPQGYELQ